MKAYLLLLTVLLCGISAWAEDSPADDPLMKQISNDIWADREPFLKGCAEDLKQLLEAVRLVKSLAPDEELKPFLDRHSRKLDERCSNELMWYGAFCAERVDVTDGSVTEGVARTKPACRSYSTRSKACSEANDAYHAAISELFAWRKTRSENAKERAGIFEDKLAQLIGICTKGE